MPKQSFEFRTPLLNAAGSLGFSPNKHSGFPYQALGAFITNPISLTARRPTAGRRMIISSGAVLLHSGHPNPGLKTVLQKNQKRWGRAELPLIVHLLAGDRRQLAGMMSMLEEVEGVMGVEISLPPEVDAAAAVNIVSAALGELPLMVHLPLYNAVLLAELVMAAGASAISLAAPRGALPDGEHGLLQGRLYAASMFPQILQVVHTLAGMGIPVVGSGAYHRQQLDALLSAGAAAVKLHTVLWRGDWGWLNVH